MDNKIALSIIIGTLLLGVGGTTIYTSFQPQTYYCDATKTAMKCDSLSQYYSLPNGKCLNSQIGNKLCKTGWLEITNDVIVEPIIQPIAEPAIEPKETTINPTSNSKQWLCSIKECVPI